MRHSGVFFCKCNNAEHDSIVYLFTKCSGCGWDTNLEFLNVSLEVEFIISLAVIREINS